MTIPSPRDVLLAARARIATPDHWTQGAWARFTNNVPVHDTDNVTMPNVCRWCLDGALIAAAYHDVLGDGATRTLQIARTLLTDMLPAEFLKGRRYVGTGLIHVFNDDETTTHHDVLALLDRAIALASGPAPLAPEPEVSACNG